jgi:hypothetical protein
MLLRDLHYWLLRFGGFGVADRIGLKVILLWSRHICAVCKAFATSLLANRFSECVHGEWSRGFRLRFDLLFGL